MRPVPDAMLEALTGSVPSIRLRAHAWRGGRLLESDLLVEKWSIDWVGSLQTMVQGQGSFTITDPEGKLSPWGLDEPLSACGSQIQTVIQLGSEDDEKAASLPVGWWAISKNAPVETWRLVGSALTWVSGGASVPVNLDELTRLADWSRFLAPESPPSRASIVAEVKRLLQGITGIVVADGVTDKAIPPSIAYKESRIAAVYDLVNTIGRARMTGTGLLEIYSEDKPAQTVWTIQGGPGGSYIRSSREQKREDFPNAVVSTSANITPEIRKQSFIQSGPNKWDDPAAGRFPIFHTAMATTDAGVQADADSYLNTQAKKQTARLSVDCIFHPGIQIGDWVTVAQPIIDGSTFNLDGIVREVHWSGGKSGIDGMNLAVECSATDLQMISQYLRGGRPH